MYKTEQNTPITDVEVERLSNGKTRVILRNNITQEERQTEEGNPYTVYTADESSFYHEGEILEETVRADFAAFWYLAEHGETRAARYARIVAEYVRARYSQNAVEAIINNYLSDPHNAEYIAEFNALQEYRNTCKENAQKEL